MLESILKKIITDTSLIKNITRWVKNKGEKRACVTIFYNEDEGTAQLLCCGSKINIITCLAKALKKSYFKSMVELAIEAAELEQDDKQ